MELKQRLAGRLPVAVVGEMARQTADDARSETLEHLCRLAADADRQVAVNALRMLIHLSASDASWLDVQRRNAFIDRALADAHPTRRRLLLTLFLKHPFASGELRADFLNFCLAGMVDVARPCSERVLCMKLAFDQCRHHDELLAELKEMMDLLTRDALSPAMASARRWVLRKMRRSDPPRRPEAGRRQKGQAEADAVL